MDAATLQCHALAGVLGVSNQMIRVDATGIAREVHAFAETRREELLQMLRSVPVPFAEMQETVAQVDPALPMPPRESRPTSRALELVGDSSRLAASDAPWCDWDADASPLRVLPCLGAKALPHFLEVGIETNSLADRERDVAQIADGCVPMPYESSTRTGEASRQALAYVELLSTKELLSIGVHPTLTNLCAQATLQWPPRRDVLLALSQAAKPAASFAAEQRRSGHPAGVPLLRKAVVDGLDAVWMLTGLEFAARLDLLGMERAMSQDEVMAAWNDLTDLLSDNTSAVKAMREIAVLCLSEEAHHEEIEL